MVTKLLEVVSQFQPGIDEINHGRSGTLVIIQDDLLPKAS